MSEFKIDGIEMPRPSDYKTEPKVMVENEQRLIENGRLDADYQQTVPVTTWTYKRMTQEQYDILYRAYIIATAVNRSIYHNISTIDHNTGNVIEYEGYTQNNFASALYRICDGKRIYHNVIVTIVGVGGDDSWITNQAL